MVIIFKTGKIIASAHEVIVKIEGEHCATLHSQRDAITLIGQGSNVIVSNSSETKWSVKIDTKEQLAELSHHLSIPIQ